jgi:hypothetical protein
MPNVLITARYFAVDPEPLTLLHAHGCELLHAERDWTLGDGNVSENEAMALLQRVEAARIYRDHPDQAVAYADIGGRAGYLDVSTRYVLPGEFPQGQVARGAVAGLASAIYTSLQVLARHADVFVPGPCWPHYAGMI